MTLSLINFTFLAGIKCLVQEHNTVSQRGSNWRPIEHATAFSEKKNFPQRVLPVQRHSEQTVATVGEFEKKTDGDLTVGEFVSCNDPGN